jgi:sporulation protein YlmC with PRC-barrel domain
VILDESGGVAAVIVGVGGFLGIGEREVALDWNDLQRRDNGGTITSGLSKAELEKLPEYEYKTASRRRSVFIDGGYGGDRAAGAPANDRRMARDRSEGRMADQTSRRADGNENWIGADRLKVSKLIGAKVVNSQGETIGEVDDLLVTAGQTRLVLSVGEFLGMGGHAVSVSLEQVSLERQRDDRDELRVSVGMTKDQLKALPEYEAAKW